MMYRYTAVHINLFVLAFTLLYLHLLFASSSKYNSDDKATFQTTETTSAPVYYPGNLPDTIFIKTEPTYPGGLLEMTFEIHLHSTNVGGIFMIVKNFPFVVDTDATSWCTWTEDFGAPLANSALFTKAFINMDVLCVSVVGANFDQLAEYGVLSSKSGSVLHCTFRVPLDIAQGIYQIEPMRFWGLNWLIPWPITDAPNFDDIPVIVVYPIVINRANAIAKKSCDINGDGYVDFADVIWYLRTLEKQTTYTASLDWNNDGICDLADAISLLRDINNGTCPDCTAQLSSTSTVASGVRGEELSREEKDYIEGMMTKMNLDGDDEALFRLAFYKATSSPQLPKAFSLLQNHPNPFNPSTTIQYMVPEGSRGVISIKVYDLRGRLVRTLMEGSSSAGSYTVFWDGKNNKGQQVSSGAYFYRIQAGDYVQTRKMILLK